MWSFWCRCRCSILHNFHNIAYFTTLELSFFIQTCPISIYFKFSNFVVNSTFCLILYMSNFTTNNWNAPIQFGGHSKKTLFCPQTVCDVPIKLHPVHRGIQDMYSSLTRPLHKLHIPFSPQSHRQTEQISCSLTYNLLCTPFEARRAEALPR